MKVVGVIPARYGAQRFPGKPLALICGKPMVRWVYEAARRSVDKVVVATDDDRVAQAVQGFGGEVMLTSPRIASGTDRVAAVARKVSADLYLNIQGDEPLLTARTLKRLVALHRDDRVCYGTAVTRLTPAAWTDPNVVKALVNRQGWGVYFSRAALPFQREGRPLFSPRPFPKGGAWKHLGVYSYTAAFLRQFVRWPQGDWEQAEKLEQLRALQNGVSPRVAYTPDDSIGVDRPDDVARVESLMKGVS